MSPFSLLCRAPAFLFCVALPTRGLEPSSDTCPAEDPHCQRGSETARADVVEVECVGANAAKEFLGISGSRFNTTYWGRHPVLIRRNCSDIYSKLRVGDYAEMFPDVFSTMEGDQAVAVTSFEDGLEFQMMNDAYANIFLGYLDGMTIALNGLNNFWPHAAAFAEELTKVYPEIFLPGHPPSMNLYLTPAGGHQVFALHNDEQDVMIMQLSGRKTWRVEYKPSERYKGMPKMGTDSTGTPSLRALLQPGDLLYVPRHHKHEAYTDDASHSASISLTNPYSARKEDMSKGAKTHKGHKKLLKTHPLPDGRIGDFSKKSTVRGTFGKKEYSNTSLRKKLRKSMLQQLQDAPDSVIEKSASDRVLEGLSRAVRGLQKRGGKSKIGQLESYSSDDALEKLSMSVVLVWLEWARWQ